MRSVWGLAAVLVLLAACQRSGIELIIYPPADPAVQVDEIRVYLGVGYGTDATIVTPGTAVVPRTAPLITGRYWSRDVNNELDVRAMTPGATKPARFVFPAQSGEILTAIAVGYLNGVPNSTIGTFDVEVPSDKFVVYKLGLNPARDANLNPLALNQVQLWGPQTISPSTNDQTCVRAENYRGDTADGYERIAYIVTDEDPDCDGYPNYSEDECQETVFHGSKVPAQDSLDCLTSDVVATEGGPITACVVAGEICEDGKPDKRVACSKSLPYCAPKSLCDECDDEFGCAITPLDHHIELQTHMACSIHYTALDEGKIQLCPQEVMTVVPPLVLGIGDQCTGVPVFRGSGSGSADGRGLDRWASRWISGMSTMSFLAVEPSCAFTIVMQGIVPFDVFPIAGLVALEVPSMRGNRGAIVPVKVDLVPGGCAQAAVCKLVNMSSDETINGCLQNIVPGL